MSLSVVLSLFVTLLACAQADQINAAFFPDSSCTGTLSSFTLNTCISGPVSTNGVSVPHDITFASADNQPTQYSLTVFANSPCQMGSPVLTNAPINTCSSVTIDSKTYYVNANFSAPTAAPTPSPTSTPTGTPTSTPTGTPTSAPTNAPTPAPTPAPTQAPTPAPTQAPTPAPTQAPTPAPTQAPTSAPTTRPTTAPTSAPTTRPTTAPTSAPTTRPTTAPTTAPTSAPTTRPTTAPTTAPTVTPTAGPTNVPFIIAVNGTNIVNVGGRVGQVAVTGLAAGATLVGIILGVSQSIYTVYVVDQSGRYYTANPTTGVATQSGQFNCSGVTDYTGYYFAYNPTNGAIRIISATGNNYRWINNNCITDGALFYIGGTPRATPTPAGVGYTNVYNTSTPTTTQEYIIDTNGGQNVWIAQVTVPNNGNTSAPVPVPGVTYGTPIKFSVTYYNGVNYGIVVVGNRITIINLSNFAATTISATLPTVTAFVAPPSNYVFPTGGVTPTAAPTAAPTTGGSTTTNGVSKVVASSVAVVAFMFAAFM